jgi:hypothetical protein
MVPVALVPATSVPFGLDVWPRTATLEVQPTSAEFLYIPRLFGFVSSISPLLVRTSMGLFLRFFLRGRGARGPSPSLRT